jgi:hypothetical protein
MAAARPERESRFSLVGRRFAGTPPAFQPAAHSWKSYSLTDESGLEPHSAKWRPYWLDGIRKLVNGENPPGKITDEAFRLLMKSQVLPHKYSDE